jgi:RNA polymerase sigma-70 factor (ECF subfamily)
VIDRERQLREWMLRALDGDAQSARCLLTEVRQHLVDYYRRRLPRHDDSIEDLAQECLLAIHAKRATYDRRLPFSAWAYAIARYKLMDHLRRVCRERAVIADGADAGGAAQADDLTIRDDLARILSTLPSPQRALVEDVRIEGYSFAEAAARHGLTEGTARVRVHRTLKFLSRWASDNDR